MPCSKARLQSSMPGSRQCRRCSAEEDLRILEKIRLERQQRVPAVPIRRWQHASSILPDPTENIRPQNPGSCLQLPCSRIPSLPIVDSFFQNQPASPKALDCISRHSAPEKRRERPNLAACAVVDVDIWRGRVARIRTVRGKHI